MLALKNLLTISTSIDSFSKIKEFDSIKTNIIYGTVGIHPHESDKNGLTFLSISSETLKKMIKLWA